MREADRTTQSQIRHDITYGLDDKEYKKLKKAQQDTYNRKTRTSDKDK